MQIWAHGTLLSPCSQLAVLHSWAIITSFSCQISCLKNINHPFLSEPHERVIFTGILLVLYMGLNFKTAEGKLKYLNPGGFFYTSLRVRSNKVITYFYESWFVKVICVVRQVPLVLWKCNIIYCCYCCLNHYKFIYKVTHIGELSPLFQSWGSKYSQSSRELCKIVRKHQIKGALQLPISHLALPTSGTIEFSCFIKGPISLTFRCKPWFGNKDFPLWTQSLPPRFSYRDPHLVMTQHCSECLAKKM